MVCNVYVLIRVSTALTALILCSSSAACTGKASVQVGDSAAEVVEEKVTWSGPEPEPERVATSADASGVPEVATPVPSDGRSVDGIEQGKRVRPVATLPGFRMLDGGVSRVFVEVTGKTTVKEARRRGLLIYRLKGVRVPERVNRLALPTSHFTTPVQRVRLVQVNRDAELRIELRVPDVEASMHLNTNLRGTVLSVDFARLDAAERARVRGERPPQ